MSHTSDAVRFGRWRTANLLSTWVAYAGFYFGRKAYYAVKAPLSRELGFDEMQLAHIGTVYLVAYAIFLDPASVRRRVPTLR